MNIKSFYHFMPGTLAALLLAFSITLSAHAEVVRTPLLPTSGTGIISGYCSVDVETYSSEVTFSCEHSLPNADSIDLHRGMMGEIGPRIHTFAEQDYSTPKVWTPSPSERAELRAGGIYILISASSDKLSDLRTQLPAVDWHRRSVARASTTRGHAGSDQECDNSRALCLEDGRFEITAVSESDKAEEITTLQQTSRRGAFNFASAKTRSLEVRVKECLSTGGVGLGITGSVPFPVNVTAMDLESGRIWTLRLSPIDRIKPDEAFLTCDE